MINAQSYIVYIGMVIVPFILAYFKSKAVSKKDQLFWLSLIILFLTLISGLRKNTVGRDSLGYAENFMLQKLSWYEVGFSFIQSLLYKIWPNYTFFFIAIAFLTNLFFVLRFNDFDKNGSSFIWSIFFFTMTSFSVGFNGMRQWLAVSICFYSTRFLFNDKGPKIFLFFVFLLLAISIHTSSFICLVFLLPIIFAKANNTKLKLLRMISIIALILFFYFGLSLFRTRNYEKLLNPNEFSFGFMSIVKYFVVVLAFISFKIEKTDNKYGLVSNKDGITLTYGSFLLIESVYIALASLSYWFDVLGRIAWFFETFETLFFAHLFSKRTKSVFIISAKILLIVIAFAKFTGNFSVSELRFPYEFFWQ